IAHMSDRAAFMAEGGVQRFFDREALGNGEHRMRRGQRMRGCFVGWRLAYPTYRVHSQAHTP
ncbi:hypothetical protein RE93_25585, partial [Klebsiella pneumoniae]